MSGKFVVSINGVEQMRGGLTQAMFFLIRRYGGVDEGISAGIKILPESLTTPLMSQSNYSQKGTAPGPMRRQAKSLAA